ncbi:MAG: cation:dicarboxylase symporter family transporter, partial [Deltaproteobacteria bacterium]|nr:cation:dicarboxylase symporter family transporter [Deltaproteobacteria bacterium]
MGERRRIGLAGKVLLGLAAGAGLGSICNVLWGGSDRLEWLVAHVTEPAGQIWLRTLMMVVLPLVFASLARGVAGLGDLRKLGRIGGKTLLSFLVLTTVSVLIGLLVVNLIRPGEGIPAETRDRM